ncbi:LysM-like peptidoglycan-binding domain-containing protein [Oceanisphaera avium]|uniref:Opacity-associated protein A LysM-like domain-containing protein n=1 Tax=Oceanisphaera avium TaxID=1903694 RepID=A0A1Y0CYL1_9GAMM|nr:LysM-like peptidoglycan-binding domain-containing protein [Oceanisphaera avium]ART79915.1 hypothetical protein CBP12_06925 [Oceanisphaera avium]
MSRRKSMKRNQPHTVGGKFNQATLPFRQGIGRGIEKWQQVPKPHKLGLLILTPLWLGLFLWQPAPALEAAPVTGSLNLSLEPKVSREIDIPLGAKRIDHTLMQGETLAALFRQWQLPGSDLIALVRAEPSYKPLSQVRVGQALTLVVNKEGQLHYIEVTDNGLLITAFRRLGQEFALVNTP